MRFSFITCTFNRANALSVTLESLCAQDFDPKDFEILVIDNNSTDNTSDIIECCIGKNENRQMRSFKELNQGLSFALNRGIQESKGDFLIYIDDDETINKDHLSKLQKYLSEYPEAVLAGVPVVPVYENAEPSWMSHFTQRLIGGYFNAGNNVIKLPKNQYPGTGHTIIKRDLYSTYGMYNTQLGRTGTSLLGAEDKDMCFRLQNNNVDCYYFPQIPVYHNIPAYKLTDQFFSKLTYSIGKSERIRTLSLSKSAYLKRLFSELIKWGASIILFFYYLLRMQPQKGNKLLLFRWNVTKGLLSK